MAENTADAPAPVSPPYRIETQRTVMRCANPTDAKLMTDAITASIEHLRPWLPWAATEPKPVAEKANQLRKFRGQFDLDQGYVYAIFNHAESEVLGCTGLHPRVGPNAFEIGYWLHADHVNQGICTETTSALVTVAFEVCKVARVEIRCDSKNLSSARVPEKLNFTHDATLRNRSTNPQGEPRDEMIWSIFPEQFQNGSSNQPVIKAYDALGNAVL